MRADSKITFFLIGLIAAFISIIPAIFLPAGGLSLHYALMECYGHEVWQGNFYPRWCMNANAAYGSPLPIFYNVVPYYISSIFYPLLGRGIGMATLYQMSLLLVSWVTFWSATVWLRGICKNKQYAMVCAAIILWLPYRMELVATRAAYTELWGMALLPFLFHYVRIFVSGNKQVWAHISLLLALCLLCHPITSFMGLIICGMYFVFFRPTYSYWLIFAGCGVLAAIAASFHWYPAMHLLPLTQDFIDGKQAPGWPNHYGYALAFPSLSFLWGTFEPIFWLSNWHMAMAVMVMMLAALLYRSQRVAKREAVMWGIVGLLSVCLFLPISQPLWNLLQIATQFIAPWRVMAMPVFACAALLALAARAYFTSRRAIWVCVVALVMGSAVVRLPSIDDPKTRELIEVSQHIESYFYTFKHLDARYRDESGDFYKRFVFDRPDAWVSLQGTGEIEIRDWESHIVTLHSHVAQDDKLVLERFYFPIWRARVDGQDVALSPTDDGTNRMSIPLSAGEHTIMLWIDMSAILPYYGWVRIISFGVWGGLLLVVWMAYRKLRVSRLGKVAS